MAGVCSCLQLDAVNHFDQHPMGHPKRKPTCLAINPPEMQQSDGVRMAPNCERWIDVVKFLELGQRGPKA